MKKVIPQMEPTYGIEEKRAINSYLDSGGWLMEFKQTEEFERMLCEYTGARFCSVLPNGTISLVVALTALGIGKGDEVIVPDFTMIATPNSVRAVGAKPVLVDVGDDMCLNPELVRRAITKRTKAVMHVSINGRAGKLLELRALCRKNHIYLIEDAAQSLGSFYRGKHLGRFGVFGSFSFSVPKIITTGQGGALVTDSKELYERVEKIKDFGRVRPGVDLHDQLGWNYKFTDLQAVLGIEQMKKLQWRTKRKKAIYSLYEKLLKDVEEVEFIPTDLKEVSPWFIDILVPNPISLHEYLKLKGIGTRLVYPPIHKQVVYQSRGVKGQFPVASQLSGRGLWLPSSSVLKNSDIEFICKEIKQYFRSH